MRPRIRRKHPLQLTALWLTAAAAAACGGGSLAGTSYGEDHDFDGTTGETGVNVPAVPIPDPECGDGNVDLDEECDDGEENDDFGDCTQECLVGVCGDGLLYEGVEQCDDGADLNGTDESICNADCTLPV